MKRGRACDVDGETDVDMDVAVDTDVARLRGGVGPSPETSRAPTRPQ